jgi:hypothetical protein
VIIAGRDLRSGLPGPGNPAQAPKAYPQKEESRLLSWNCM